ncbi:MAG: hypothetical protein V2A64_06210 [Candidatus Omnitrophota bacterium]
MGYKSKNGQSILEYAILMGVIIAAVLVMQMFIKRHFAGGLKESAEKMGEAFSTSGTTISRSNKLTENQIIKEEVATTAKINEFLPDDKQAKGVKELDVYSFVDRSGKQTSEVKQHTESATQEKFRNSEHAATTADDFTSDGITF